MLHLPGLIYMYTCYSTLLWLVYTHQHLHEGRYKRHMYKCQVWQCDICTNVSSVLSALVYMVTKTKENTWYCAVNKHVYIILCPSATNPYLPMYVKRPQIKNRAILSYKCVTLFIFLSLCYIHVC